MGRFILRFNGVGEKPARGTNLVGMGVLPLEFKNGQSRDSLGLDGTESFVRFIPVLDPAPA